MFKNMSKFEKIMIVFCCIALLLLTHFIINDGWLFGKKTKVSNEGNIGSIKVSVNDVRRKSPVEFIWMNPKENDVVFKGDSIFTGVNSKAKVELSNGTVIEVQENSLVVLDIKGDDVLLDLKFGQFQGQIASGNIQIKNKNETVKVNATKGSIINLSKSKSGKFNVKSLVGKSSITIKNKVLAIEQNKSAEVTDQGKVEVMTMEDITTPTPNLNLVIYPTFKQDISWSTPKGTASYELAFSETEQMGSIDHKKLKVNSYSLSYKDLKPSLYWKVRAYNNKTVLIGESSTFKITTNLYPRPELVTPLPLAKIEFNPKTFKDRNSNVEFKVKSVNEFKTPIILEIAQDNQFKINVIKASINKENFVQNLKEGVYFARIIEDSTIAKSNNFWSEPIQFELIANLSDGQVLPPEPKLTRYNFFPEYDKEGVINRSKTPRISWTPSEKTVQYQIELSSNPQFKNSKIYETKNTDWNWEDFTWGRSYIKIKSQSLLGNLSDDSKVIELNVLPKKPILENPAPALLFSEQPEPQSFNLKWSKIPEATKYKIEYTQSDFKNAKTFESRSPASAVVIDQPGSYKWRVVALGDNNKKLTAYSDEGNLQFILKKPLVKPALVSPYNNTTIYQQIMSASNLWLEWKPVEGAENYYVEIATDPEFKSANKYETKKHKFMLSNKQNGKMYWRIRAIASTFESTWSDPRFFEIKSEEIINQKKGLQKK